MEPKNSEIQRQKTFHLPTIQFELHVLIHWNIELLLFCFHRVFNAQIKILNILSEKFYFHTIWTAEKSFGEEVKNHWRHASDSLNKKHIEARVYWNMFFAIANFYRWIWWNVERSCWKIIQYTC